MLKILALIPARSGSQRVKNKNIKLLKDKPLIAYSIECAMRSKFINRIIVSTDSSAIAEVAVKYGAEVPFLRPEELATGSATEYEFHIHALEWLHSNEDYIPDFIVNLYPTAPFRKTSSIDEAMEIFLQNTMADSLRSVKKCSEHPYKMWKKENDFLAPFVDTGNMEVHTFSYQMLPTVYIQNANIYITKPETLKKYKNTLGENVLGYVMDEWESVDINSEMDFKLAENLLENEKK